jgi:hypothetical protein
MGMPLGRYFVFAGVLLLALLFLADRYMPQTAAAPARAEVDRSIIRLQSRHQWPERIVIDTSLPTIVPPPGKLAEVPPLNAAAVARSPSEAFALVTSVQATTPVIVSKPTPKRRTRTARAGGHIAGYDAIAFRNAFPAGW